MCFRVGPLLRRHRVRAAGRALVRRMAAACYGTKSHCENMKSCREMQFLPSLKPLFAGACPPVCGAGWMVIRLPADVSGGGGACWVAGHEKERPQGGSLQPCGRQKNGPLKMCTALIIEGIDWKIGLLQFLLPAVAASVSRACRCRRFKDDEYICNIKIILAKLNVFVTKCHFLNIFFVL